MLFFRSAPADIIQINEKTSFDLYIKNKDKLELYLEKDSVYTPEHHEEIQQKGITQFYVRGKDRKKLDKYTLEHIDKILSNPDVPSNIKADAFYRTSADTMKQAFDDPQAEHLDGIKKSVKPMLKNIMQNEKILKDLFNYHA